jgi:hypothetical protein
MTRALRCAGLLVLETALLLACTGSVRTSTEPTAPPAAEPVAFTTLVQAAVPGQSGAGVQEVVRDEAGYRALWAGLAVAEAPPPVDFSRRMVIAAALPTQGCVAKVTIQGIVRDATGLRIDVLEQYPGPDCRCIVSSRPFHVVALDRRSEPVRFHATRGPNTC